MKELIKKFAVMGNPIAHSRSPQLHQAFAKQFQLNIDYQKILVEKNNFIATLDQFRKEGGCGVSVTLPFKEAAYHYATHTSARAQLAKAVNTLTFNEDGSSYGDNTDGLGFVTDLKINHQLSLTKGRVLIFGAGGSVRGLLAALAEVKDVTVTLANRTLANAQKLVAEFSPHLVITCLAVDDSALTQNFYDVVVNSLPTETNEVKNFWVATQNFQQTFCYDLNYGTRSELFLQWANTHGCQQSADGSGMLIEQAAAAFQLWFGVKPDTTQKDVLGVMK